MRSELAEKIVLPIDGVAGLKRTSVNKTVLKTKNGWH
jgi:hypothetical protein|tara:strand:+ start:54 stop:164 length:111 start_codon:yes stop_codon:yes gene_type:complete